MTASAKENLFRPVPSRTETKADITDRVAREIIQSETDKRNALTQRLRAARLAQEAVAAAAPPVAKRRAGKTA